MGDQARETKTRSAVPAVSEWLEQLKAHTRKKAERWVGRLNTIRSSGDSDKKELLKASILAFESYRRKEELDRYRDGVKKILEKTTFKNWPIEIVCLVGKPPPPEWADASGTGPKGEIDGLKNVDARIVFYDELLTNAEQPYADYLDEHVKMNKLWGQGERAPS